MKRTLSIAVVGGGPGGLFCTYLLNQKVPDARVTLFESSGRLGGKIITDQFDESTPFEAGVAELYEYLGPDKDPMRQLIEKDLGLKTVDMSGGGVLLRGKLVRDYDDFGKKFGKDSQTRLEKFYKKCARLMPLETFATRWQPNNSHPWADRTFRDCIRKEVSNDPAVVEYIEAAVASDLATESHTCNGLNGIKNCLMDNDKYMQVYHIVGGLENLPHAIVSKLRADIYLNTRLVLLLKSGGGRGESGVSRYQLSLRCREEADQRAEFDAVFVCVPNHWLTQIQWGGDRLQRAMHRILEHYDLPAHYLRVSMLFDQPFWRKYRMPGDFFMADCLNGCCVYDEHHRWERGSGGGNVLSILVAGQDALLQCSGGQSDEEVVNHVIESFPLKVRRKMRKHIVESQVDRFVGAINAQPGGWPSKDLRAEHCPEPQEHPNLYLVGDYFFDSTINAALASANVATNLLVESLGRDLDDANLTDAVEDLGEPHEPLSM